MDFSGQLSLSGGYLDNEFITSSDDSLVLLYRPNSLTDWEIYSDYELNVLGSNTDKRGVFELSKLMLGEYAIGMYDHTIADAPADETFICPDEVLIYDLENATIQVYPVPADNYVFVQINQNIQSGFLHIFNANGDSVQAMPLNNNGILSIHTEYLPAGIYAVRIEDEDHHTSSVSKLLIIH
jgi:hypothetical protein